MSFIDVDSLRAHLVEANRHVAELQDSIRNSAERRELEVARVELAAAEQRNVDINDALQSCVASENALKATLERRTALLREACENIRKGVESHSWRNKAEHELDDAPAEQPGKAEPPKCICAELIRQGFIGVQLDEMCPYLYHYHPAAHPAPAAPEATSDTCQPQPAQTKLTIVKQLPVPWEDVWVSSSDGTWTFDKVVERKELDDDHFQTATHGIMTRKSEGWLWDYFDVRTTKNDRVYQPAPAALETPAMCPKCSSTDLDERGNCYACLASASEPAPQPAEVTTENLDRLENILTISRWGRQPDDISSFAVIPTGCFVARDAAILACGRDVNANIARETGALRKRVAELERAALDFGATAAEFRLSDGTIKPKCPRPAYGDHFLGQLRNQCALCSQVAVLVETIIAPILAERDEARAQRDSLQAAATRLEAQRVDLERKLVETLERLDHKRPWPS